MKKTNKLLKNTVFSLLLQIITIISGFILPKFILSYFGSDTNGLVHSISQFLQIIAFLELGVGAVVLSALYEPLVKKDRDSISRIIVSADKFFKRIGLALLIYVVVLVFVYPAVTNRETDYFDTAILIVAISASSFAQYYFGIVDKLLLLADQRGYIYYISEIFTIIASTAVCVILTVFGCSIQIVKLSAAVVFIIRPILLRIYINRHYPLNRKITYSEEPIRQKWSGISQHISGVILDHTDTIILTVLSTLSSVSIYSVYNMVIYGVKTLFTSLTNGVQALLGELYAKKDKKQLDEVFDWTEWSIHTGVVFVFGCTALLIVPFIQVYTKGVDDADYYQPLFAALIVIAHAVHCLRLPYHIMIKAGGHYKETQYSYIIAAAINVVISVAAVKPFGLAGIAAGTLVAMLYQTLWMVYYNSKCLLKRPVKYFCKQLIVDIITVALAVVSTHWIQIKDYTYISWLLMAVEVAAILCLIVLVVNIIFYREKVVRLLRIIRFFKKRKQPKDNV